MIEALSLTKVYGGKAAIDGIDFCVKPGMVTGFLGPNGAGKPVTGLRRSLLSCAWRKVMPHGLRASRS
jgi:ABC-type uncharacterized transport system ATPase subunit